MTTFLLCLRCAAVLGMAVSVFFYMLNYGRGDEQDKASAFEKSSFYFIFFQLAFIAFQLIT